MARLISRNLPRAGMLVAGVLSVAVLGAGVARMRAQSPARPDLAGQAKSALAQHSGTIVITETGRASRRKERGTRVPILIEKLTLVARLTFRSLRIVWWILDRLSSDICTR